MVNYVRRKSAPIDVAKTRWQGLLSQDPVMDLGHGLTLQMYETSIVMVETQLLKVNKGAAENQTERAILREMEKDLRDLNDRFMKATAVKYGTSSMEVMAIGGVRKKDRKRPVGTPPADLSSDQ